MTENANPSTNSIPTESELIARAAALVPMLRENAERVERERSVPADIVQAFKDAGFFKILQPKRWGGWEMNPAVFYKVLMELGRGCSSSGWVMMILGIHQWEFGLFPQQAGDDVWGEDSGILVGSSYPPVCTAQRVEGGWKIGGRWPTSSGCDHAQWSILAALVKDDNGKVVDRLHMLVPRTEYEIEDDWYVCGLAGTGSKTLVVRETFVPDHRTHTAYDQEMPGIDPYYRLSFKLTFFCAVAAVINGMASGAVDYYRAEMSQRQTTAYAQAVSLSPYVKDRLGNAVARVRSSRVRLLNIVEEGYRYINQGMLIPESEFVPYLLDIARVSRECEEAVLLLFKATAARGIFLHNPIQRVLRDVLCGANHITQNADDTAGILGGYLLGQPLPPMFLSRG